MESMTASLIYSVHRNIKTWQGTVTKYTQSSCNCRTPSLLHVYLFDPATFFWCMCLFDSTTVSVTWLFRVHRPVTCIVSSPLIPILYVPIRVHFPLYYMHAPHVIPAAHCVVNMTEVENLGDGRVGHRELDGVLALHPCLLWVEKLGLVRVQVGIAAVDDVKRFVTFRGCSVGKRQASAPWQQTAHHPQPRSTVYYFVLFSYGTIHAFWCTSLLPIFLLPVDAVRPHVPARDMTYSCDQTAYRVSSDKDPHHSTHLC